MPKISSQIVITKTVLAVFGNENGGMCLVFIKKSGLCSIFPFFLFFSPLLLDMLYLFGQHCVNVDPAPHKKAVLLCPILESG